MHCVSYCQLLLDILKQQRMTNLYWSIFKNLEKEVISLSEFVHFDDNQLSIYSVKIAELLIRCSVEIESISKDLYFRLGGTIPTDRDLYFDTDCLQLLEDNWLLSKKKVILAASNFYFQNDSNRVLTPLNKANRRGKSGADWKKAYQAVKHNRVDNLNKGNINNIIRSLAALYILNIYFKEENYDLEKDSKATNFPTNMGSELFAIKLHKWISYDGDGIYGKSEDFDECIYLTKWKKESEEKINTANEKMHEANTEFLLNHPKFSEWSKANKLEDYKGNNLAWDVLGKDIYIQMLNKTSKQTMDAHKSIEYEAILNKKNI